MKNKDHRREQTTPLTSSGQALRRQAEEINRGKAAQSSEDSETLSPEETRKTLHELRVHQIELEMQNEELRRAQVELDAVRERYFDLFDLAPVGYFTLSEKGVILEANLTAAALLGVARGSLIRQPLTRFILKEDQNIYYLHRKQVFKTGERQVCELRMLRADADPFWVRVDETVSEDGESGDAMCRAVVSDITERKRVEEALQQAHDELEQLVAERTEELMWASEKLRAEITERKQAAAAMGERLQFEQLLSGLSARFVNMPSDRVDSEIEDGLRQIFEFFQVDHCALIRTLPGKTSYQITHIASSEDVPPVPVGVELPRSIYPWAYERLTEKNEVVSISRLDDLPAEANVDRRTCIEWGIRSYVNIPILIGESVDHIIHVSSVKSERVWPEEVFPRLRLLGEIFVNALQRKRAEEASRESERILRQNENDLRKLAGRLIYAQEEERSRLARELHDDLAQRLAVFAIDVGRLEERLTDPPAPVREELREMQNSIVKISQDVHSLSRQLHPSILDDLGLIKAAESECTSFSRREGIDVVFKHENIPMVIPKDVSLSLYRIIQEGLRNISKHACAEHISVSLKGLDHDVLLSVQDDGIGFEWAEVKENPGLGFSSMRERARLIHGELSIQSEPEKGTVITLRVPLTRERE